jgi:hypothetical protein
MMMKLMMVMLSVEFSRCATPGRKNRLLLLKSHPSPSTRYLNVRLKMMYVHNQH